MKKFWIIVSAVAAVILLRGYYYCASEGTSGFQAEFNAKTLSGKLKDILKYLPDAWGVAGHSTGATASTGSGTDATGGTGDSGPPADDGSSGEDGQ